MKRGACRECGFRWRLSQDGYVQAHTVWHGGTPERCIGSYLPPKEAE
jgi:hypothetical protein